GPACSTDTACPEEAPCCSEFGFCGAGRSNCLTGCNALGSFQPSACAPVPACRSGEYHFDAGTQRILANSSWWNGDAEQYDWLLGPVTVDSSDWKPALTLSLAEGSNGTTITSTRSILYGNVSARIRSAAGPGILTSFTLLSGTADEILFEFTTNSTEVADTAYFFRGDVDGYKSGKTVNVTNRSEHYHDYTFVWTPEQIAWLVDGVPVRTVSKEDTASGWFDKTYRFPRTPARVRLSIWAAGGADQPDNVVEFAGGPINWNSSEYMQKGYYASYGETARLESHLRPPY
ncbi:concanavalin A-like lectin/glucanase, partial [Rhodotorula sp. JG-1b]